MASLVPTDAPQLPSSPGPDVLEAACRAWSDFDWSGHQASIQETLRQAKEAREASLAARKSLAETTRQFKKAVKGFEVQAATAAAASDDATAASEALGRLSRSMVKSYQEEVDQLTRRCKSLEAAYQSLGTDLVQGGRRPDPFLALRSGSDEVRARDAEIFELRRTVDALRGEIGAAQAGGARPHPNDPVEGASASGAPPSGGTASSGGAPATGSADALSRAEREELVQLRREVAEYEVEFRSLKNQDITIRKLEARIVDLQTSAKDSLSLQLDQAKQELAETEGRRAADALEREAAMERKVQTLELQLRAERAGREATQAHLLQADEGVNQREAAWEAQRRILLDDAERLREQLHAVASERDELAMRVAAARSTGRGGAPAPGSATGGALSPPASGAGGASITDLMLERRAYEAEVAELSETTSLLRDEIRAKEEGLATERRASTAKIQGLERQATELAAKIAALESQLALAPNPDLVDSMKRQLRVLKSLEYNADDVEDADGDDRDPEIAGINEEAKDLESVLVAKLRRVESDLVTERTSRVELREEMESLKNALEESEKSKVDLEKLVSSLEADLERAIATSSAAATASKSSSRSNSSRKLDVVSTDGTPSTLLQVLDPDAVPPPELPPAPSPALPRSASITAQERADDDHSVATIVMAQRDRLRARCDALEAERDSFKHELQVQVQASESLKSDNTKLYEKVRYLQNFSKQGVGGGGGGGGPVQRGSAYHRGSLADRDLDLEALEQRYEASVDPFRQFSRAERQRKLNEMSPMERTVYLVAKTFLATKEMRTALFVYVLAMHLLVFITTYHWSHTGGCHNVMDMEHLSHLPPALPADMQQAVAANANSNHQAAP